MREIVIDTETTGLDPEAGHRVVEIAGLELVNHIPTGRVFHRYANPKRDMPEEAFAIHGISTAFLADKPEFSAFAEEFTVFIGEDPLVIHNAEFDLKFLNAELRLAERPPLVLMRVVDTLSLARRRFPGMPNSLDALCKRFAVDTSARTKHGARLDAELLARIYLELIGGRQPGLELAATLGVGELRGAAGGAGGKAPRPKRPHAPSGEELAAHKEFVAALTDPLWLKQG